MTRILVQGCKAGTIAGLIWGVLTLGFISPLIQKAETFESAAAVSEVHEHHHNLDDHDGTKVFEPNAWQRPLLTVLGSGLIGVAFGILLSLVTAFAAARGSIVRFPLWAGAILGFAGFLVFHGIPSIGLRPELPGVIGAENDYDARQSWWVLSVACSALGVLTFGFGSVLLKRILGEVRPLVLRLTLGAISAFLVAIPFVRGVPDHSEASVVPAALKAQFLWTSTGVNAGFWLMLGVLLFFFLARQTEN